MGDWDKITKDMIQQNPQPYVDMLIDGEVVTSKPLALEEAKLEMDNLILVRTRKRGNFILVDIEVQTYKHINMADRLLEYNVKTRKKYKYKVPVLSCVMYLLRDGKKSDSPHVLMVEDFESIRFGYKKVEVGNWTREELVGMGVLELLPLFPLTVGGKSVACWRRYWTSFMSWRTSIW